MNVGDKVRIRDDFGDDGPVLTIIKIDKTKSGTLLYTVQDDDSRTITVNRFASELVKED